MSSRQIYTYIFFMVCSCLAISASAQKPKLSSTSWRDNWKIEIKTGAGAILSKVPEQYLQRINSVNVPTITPGITGVAAIRKGISKHFEMGYQFNYLYVQGDVTELNQTYRVRTQALENNFLIGYNLKAVNEYRPPYNYFIYYKVGAIALKNEPHLRLPDGSLSPEGPLVEHSKFIQNVAVGTGLGLEITRQLTNNISLNGTFELSRSSDLASDTYQLQKIFYNSPNTVNRYTSFCVGVCYTFNLYQRKQSQFFRTHTLTEKMLKIDRIKRKKGPYSSASKATWFQERKK